MRVHFWGARGSLPASIPPDAIRQKVIETLRRARGHRLESDEAIENFVDSALPFALRGSYGCNTSCVELQGGDACILCDAGSGLRDFGNRIMTRMARGEPTPKEFNIFLSHPHWDHIQGFPFFTPAFIPGNRINVYGGHKDLEAVFAGQQVKPYFPVPISVMQAERTFTELEPGRQYTIAGMEVGVIRQNHPGGSFGYSFIKDGKKFVYSTDCEHKREAEQKDYPFLDFFRDADVLVFDAQYKLIEAIEIKENWGHSSNLVAVELAVRSGVKRLCLFHSEHTFDDIALDKFLDDTRKYARLYAPDSPLQIDLSYDGLEVAL